MQMALLWFDFLCFCVQGVSGALAVLMKDAIRPNLMQTLEVSQVTSLLFTTVTIVQYSRTRRWC